MFKTQAVEKIKTHISYSIYIYIYILNSVIYEIMWKNTVESDDDIIRPRIDVIYMPCRFLCKTCFEILPISLKLHCCRSVCTIKIASGTFTGHVINAVCCLWWLLHGVFLMNKVLRMCIFWRLPECLMIPDMFGLLRSFFHIWYKPWTRRSYFHVFGQLLSTESVIN